MFWQEALNEHRRLSSTKDNKAHAAEVIVHRWQLFRWRKRANTSVEKRCAAARAIQRCWRVVSLGIRLRRRKWAADRICRCARPASNHTCSRPLHEDLPHVERPLAARGCKGCNCKLSSFAWRSFVTEAGKNAALSKLLTDFRFLPAAVYGRAHTVMTVHRTAPRRRCVCVCSTGQRRGGGDRLTVAAAAGSRPGRSRGSGGGFRCALLLTDSHGCDTAWLRQHGPERPAAAAAHPHPHGSRVPAAACNLTAAKLSGALMQSRRLMWVSFEVFTAVFYMHL